jgi:hypothetical protein
VHLLLCTPWRLVREAPGLVPDFLGGPRTWVARRIDNGIGEVESALRGLGLLPATRDDNRDNGTDNDSDTDDDTMLSRSDDDRAGAGDRADRDETATADHTPIAGMPEAESAPAVVTDAGPSDAGLSDAGLAIPDYDSLSASQVVPRLDGLTDDELEDVRRHEEAGRGRRTILSKIAQLQTG